MISTALRKTTVRIVLVSVAATLTLLAATAAARQFQGVKVAESVVVQGKRLRLNGVGLLEATVFNIDIYVAALYLEKSSRDASVVIDGKHRWCVITHFLRDIGGGQLADGWRERLQERAGRQLPKFEKRIARLCSLLPDVKTGDRHAFIYTPDKGLEIRVNGKRRGAIPGADFCPLVAKAFVGPDVDQDLRRALLKGF